MKVGFNNDELQQLVKDLKAGVPWEQVVRDRCHVLNPGVLEASDYKEWAHREAGIPLPETPPAAPPPSPPADAEPEAEEDHARGRRGRK